MDSAKKILILHASAGHGHEKAALAVAETLARQGAPVTVRDSLDLVRPAFGKFYKNSYLSMIKNAPPLWGLSYYSMDVRALGPLVRPIRRLVNAKMARAMREYILSEKPDALVCTHFMPVEVAGHMKRRGEWKGKIVTVITDYLSHAFWIDRSTDVYAVGSDRTVEDLLRRGIPRDKIKLTGLPTMQAFRTPQNGPAERRKFGLAEFPTVLLTSGGAGVGPIEEMAGGLSLGRETFQVLVVCGTNKALFERLSVSMKGNSSVRVFGFVNNMHELMAASDIVVGKAGGLTLSESFCLGLPVIMVKPVPGQEGRNALVVSSAGAGVTTHAAAETVRVTRSILANRPRLQEMKDAARRLGRPGAAGAIAELALS